MATPLDHQELKQDLSSSREAMTAYVTALRHDLDFGAKLRRGVRNNPLACYAAAGLLGLLLAKIPPSRRKVVVKRPKLNSDAPKEAGKAAMALTIFKSALDFAKPALLRWIRERYFGTAFAPRHPNGKPL